MKEHDPNQPQIPDHSYRILIKLIKIYLYAKDLYEAEYQFLINKRKNMGLKYFDDSKSFIEYSSDLDDIHKNIEVCNPNKKGKTLFLMIQLLIFLVVKNLIQQ